MFQKAREQKGPVPERVISSLIEDFNLFSRSEAVQEIVNRTKIHPLDAFISLFPKEQDKFKARNILIEHLKPLQGPSDKGNLISTPQGAQ